MTLTITDPQVEPKNTWEYKRFLPKGFNTEAATPLEALIQAHALLLDEERWIQGEWYQNHHPEADPDDPFCNDWKVCAAGAVAMVAIGAARQTARVVSEWDSDTQQYKRAQCPVLKDKQHWTLVLETPENTDDLPEGLDVYNQACEFLRQGASQVGTGGVRRWESVPSFNDAGFVTRADVLKAFSKGIAIAAQAQVEADVKERIKRRLTDALAVA